MTKVLLLILSAGLVAAGVALVWRDVHRRRRDAFLVRGDATAGHPEAEVVVARSAPDVLMPRVAAGAAAGAADGTPPPATSGLEPADRWAALQAVIDPAVERVNGILGVAGVAIGAPGEPSWSLMKKGYGVHRRILIGGESVAWLRLELDGSGQVLASVKAHKDDHAAVNASASAAVHGLDVARASDLLSESLRPAAGFAVGSAGGSGIERWASETAWKEIDPLVAAALRAANGALGQAGARFLPVGTPAWAEDVRRHRLTVRVEVSNVDAARMHIERIGEEVEVAVGLADARLADLGRRQRVPLPGLTTHALAELIASCAWPAIVHGRER